MEGGVHTSNVGNIVLEWIIASLSCNREVGVTEAEGVIVELENLAGQQGV